MDNVTEDQLREKIKAEIEADYNKKADSRVTNAIKRREKEWAEKLYMEQTEKQLAEKAESEKNAEELRAKEVSITEKSLSLAVVDVLERYKLPVSLRGCIIVSDIAMKETPEERNKLLNDRVLSLKQMFEKTVNSQIEAEKKEYLRGISPITSSQRNIVDLYDRAMRARDVKGMIGAKLFDGYDY